MKKFPRNSAKTRRCVNAFVFTVCSQYNNLIKYIKKIRLFQFLFVILLLFLFFFRWSKTNEPWDKKKLFLLMKRVFHFDWSRRSAALSKYEYEFTLEYKHKQGAQYPSPEHTVRFVSMLNVHFSVSKIVNSFRGSFVCGFLWLRPMKWLKVVPLLWIARCFLWNFRSRITMFCDYFNYVRFAHFSWIDVVFCCNTQNSSINQCTSYGPYAYTYTWGHTK